MKSQNLNFLKFIAALLVIYSHAYPLTGADGADEMSQISRGAFTFGGFAVAIFFFSSGFFVTKSIIRKEANGFWKGRIVRIYPAFVTVIVLSAFVMGPIVSTLSAMDYFTNPCTYKYLLYLVMFPVYSLPGVFENHPYPNCVNGALWTIILEMICYAALWIAYKLGLLNNKKIVKTLGVIFALVIVVLFSGKIAIVNQYSGYLRPACIFIVGMVYALCEDNIKRNVGIGIVLSFIWGVMVVAGVGNVAMIMIFPYMLYCLIFAKKQVPKAFGKMGEFSYSIYLVGFPIQQLMYMSGIGESIVSNALSSMIVSIIVGYILYMIIEKPAVKKWA